jgi:hypothetical protein
MRADAINHHHYESAIIHVQPIASSNKLVRSIPRERAVGVGAKIGFVKAGHGGDRCQQVLSAPKNPFFSEALVRSWKNYVRAHMSTLTSNRRALWPDYKAFYCRILVATSPSRIFASTPFLSFSTWGNSGIEPDKGTGNQLSRKV